MAVAIAGIAVVTFEAIAGSTLAMVAVAGTGVSATTDREVGSAVAIFFFLTQFDCKTSIRPIY